MCVCDANCNIKSADRSVIPDSTTSSSSSTQHIVCVCVCVQQRRRRHSIHRDEIVAEGEVGAPPAPAAAPK
uniref:Uncharacterized protein n=1 Tax=Globodera rostochiensis TaxID=31243 RepID=A0A914H8I6_GLORO